MSQQNYQRIWQTITAIPEGKVATYGQVADLAGLPKRARLVGKALANAPEKLAVPWFRVINAQGRISLPKGSEGFERQRQALQAEGVKVCNGRVKLNIYQWQPELAELLFILKY